MQNPLRYSPIFLANFSLKLTISISNSNSCCLFMKISKITLALQKKIKPLKLFPQALTDIKLHSKTNSIWRWNSALKRDFSSSNLIEKSPVFSANRKLTQLPLLLLWEPHAQRILKDFPIEVLHGDESESLIDEKSLIESKVIREVFFQENPILPFWAFSDFKNIKIEIDKTVLFGYSQKFLSMHTLKTLCLDW